MKDANVVIVADCDAPGRKHARSVAKALEGVAAAVRVVEAAEGKDASDHLTAGYGLGDFVEVDHQLRLGEAEPAPTARPNANGARGRSPGGDDFDRFLSSVTSARQVGDGGEWSALCPVPAHDDRNPSLSFKRGDGGKLVVHCHAGCSYEDIMRAVGMWRDSRMRATEGVQPGTDSASIPQIPDAFWSANPQLGHIREAARSRIIAPDALLGAVLARLCTYVHWAVQLPAVVARRGSLNICVALVGNSGAAKGASMDTADEILPVPNGLPDSHRLADGVFPAGTGEGMVELFFGEVQKTSGKGKEKIQVHDSILFRVDEGQMLTALGDRSGSTTLLTIRQMWSGETPRPSYVKNNGLMLSAHRYRVALVMAIQPTKARRLLNDSAGGTPQRFEWFATVDAGAPDKPPKWPGPIPWKLPAQQLPLSYRGDLFDVDDSVAAEIIAHRQRVNRGELSDGDEHRNLRRLKIAALLGFLDGRWSVTPEDWRLAGLVAETSVALRNWAWSQIRAEDATVERGKTANAVSRTRATTAAEEETRDDIERVGRVIARAVRRHDDERKHEGACRRRCIKDSVASRDNDLRERALTRAVARGWIVESDEGAFTLGTPP